MARQHSGETQSSFVLEGIVDFLMSNTELDQVKKNYLFFIFPMINVDGVKYGHYRTNLCGVDLNRIWRTPRKDSHP
jgi:murein tripeptide amidase MpaA